MALIIFDCDGVLVESEAIYIRAELEFLRQAGVAFERDDYVRTYMGMATNEWQNSLSEIAMERHGTRLDAQFFQQLASHIQTQFEQQLIAVDGARRTLSKLAQPMCVASSSPPQLLAWKLAHTGLSDLFEPHLFSTALVSRGKPEPDLFLHAAQAMGFVPGDCFVVEDSCNGVTAGKRAGMTTIGITAGSHCPANHGQALRDAGADIVIDRFERLAPTIDGLR